jgi:hypothetical protein
MRGVFIARINNYVYLPNKSVVFCHRSLNQHVKYVDRDQMRGKAD